MLQALAIRSQNDAYIADFAITAAQFEACIQRNRFVEEDGISVVPENNEAMTESYAMVDPAGRFFDNAQGSYKYSEPILTVGIEKALKQLSISLERFSQRGGRYDWSHSS